MKKINFIVSLLCAFSLYSNDDQNKSKISNNDFAKQLAIQIFNGWQKSNNKESYFDEDKGAFKNFEKALESKSEEDKKEIEKEINNITLQLLQSLLY